MSDIPSDVIQILKTKLKSAFRLDEAQNIEELVAAHDRAEQVQGVPGGQAAGGSSMRLPRRFLFAQSHDKPLILLVAEDFELAAQGLVVDYRLGNLGIVQVCPQGTSDQPRNVVPQIESHIQHAVYLRHRLGELEANGRRPFSIELVLVVPKAHVGVRAVMADVLRKLMERTTYLHAIGINFLVENEAGSFDSAALRRAFSWLLVDVEHWYAGKSELDDNRPSVAGTIEKAGPPKAPGRSHALAALTLENFRLPGKRIWEFSHDVTLHVVHGRNGSGKSSLVEAIELAVTGRIARLENGFASREKIDYAKVLCNRQVVEADPQAVAKIGMRLREPLGDSRELHWEIVPLPNQPAGAEAPKYLRPVGSVDDLPLPFNGFCDAGSFLLHQPFTDDLIRSDVFRRAERFLAAFYPSEKDAIEEAHQAERKFQAAWDALDRELQRLAWHGDEAAIQPPDPLGEKPTAAEVTSNLRWLEDADQAFARLGQHTALGRLEGALVALNLLRTLDASSPALSGADAAAIELRLRDRDDDRMAALNEAGELLRLIDPLIPFIEQLNRWQASQTGVYGLLDDLAGEMNNWLELHAACDLAEKETDVFETLQAARQAGVDERLRFLRLAKLDPTTVEPYSLDPFRSQRDKARSRVAQYRLEERTDRSARPRPRFSDDQLRLCDRLFPLGSQTLSSLIKEAMEYDKVEDAVVDNSTIVSGSPGGCQQLLDRMQDLKQRLAGVLSVATEISAGGADCYRRLLLLREAASERAATQYDALERFRRHLQTDSSLAKALNELIAMLTPARWAYEDLTPRAEDSCDRVGVDFVTLDGISLSKRWNTSELNTLTLALFVLCAPMLENPLRLLLLDDPFQNMDELTLLTIARGLGRLLEMWRQSERLGAWQVVILLHSAEGVERCRREVPCAAYYLPWLSPIGTVPTGDAGNHDVIPCEGSRLSCELSPLVNVIK